MLVEAFSFTFCSLITLEMCKRKLLNKDKYLQSIQSHSNVQDFWAANHHLSQADKLNPVSNHLYHVAVSEQNVHTSVAVKIEPSVSCCGTPFHVEGSKHLWNKVNYYRFYWHANQRVLNVTSLESGSNLVAQFLITALTALFHNNTKVGHRTPHTG